MTPMMTSMTPQRKYGALIQNNLVCPRGNNSRVRGIDGQERHRQEIDSATPDLMPTMVTRKRQEKRILLIRSAFPGTVVLAYKAYHGLMNSVHGDVDKVFNAGSRTASCHDYRSKGVDG